MPRTRTDEILEELLSNPEPERPLHGHEILRMTYAGRIPPGEYRYETDVDGGKQIETFEADEEGRIKNLKIWVENPDPASPKCGRQGVRARKSRAVTAAKRGAEKPD